jgi:hypothetical protein
MKQATRTNDPPTIAGHEEQAMSNENLITFLKVDPIERDGEIIYPATLGGLGITMGITPVALDKLRSGRPSGIDNAVPDSFDPVHGEAQVAIQRKYDFEGLDSAGRVLVTEEDLAAHNGLNG